MQELKVIISALILHLLIAFLTISIMLASHSLNHVHVVLHVSIRLAVIAVLDILNLRLGRARGILAPLFSFSLGKTNRSIVFDNSYLSLRLLRLKHTDIEQTTFVNIWLHLISD